ncbi:Fungal hydrophobin [Ceratobasidium sp. AG-Ba]|nr:Fungal hydrophobin [Ceratobasidium sp. AG-Ba]QRW01413.1 Fungal hydrophobin [Ceratobasidium sp. AG-Ba]
MRSILSLILVAGLVAASPTPLSPAARQNPYDIKLEASDAPSYSNKHPECHGMLQPGCGPLHLGGSGILAGDSASGVMGAQSGANVAGIHVRHGAHSKKGLLDGAGVDAITKPIGGLGLLHGEPLQGLGLKRSIKRLVNLGHPSKAPLGFGPKADTCPAANRYCCKNVRRYSDPRNAGLLDGALVQDGLLNDVLVGLTCDLVAGALAPNSCANRVCCTGQRSIGGGKILYLGCTALAGSLVDI